MVKEAQPIFLEAARQVDPRRLRLTTRYLRYVLDPDGAQASEEELHERRRLHLSRHHHRMVHEGGWRLVPDGAGRLTTLPP